ncbi:HU family DNA-binding protein [Alistipes putredinis]|uniref:HU family DNA-binding protein n=1 Tax=Alistipes putredinis TaxID=28117 RepID=UPI003AB83B69
MGFSRKRRNRVAGAAENRYFCKYNEHQYAALMTKAEIVKQIAGQTGLESKMVAGVVEALLERIRAAQIGGQNVYFRGFGSFVRRERAAKKARDISRNTTVLVPAHTVPAFKPSKAFVECLKK